MTGENTEKKYQQVEQYIKDLIKDELEQGDQIPTEYELAKKFGVSRVTVNKALTNLSNQGLITRTAGKGSFVSSIIPIGKDYNTFESFSETIKKMHKQPSAKLIKYELLMAEDNPTVKEALEIISPTQELHHFVRLRFADDVPMGILDTYINKAIISDFDLSCLSKSFYEYLDSISFPRTNLRCELTAVMPTLRQTKLLEIGKTEPLLQNIHVVYTEGKKPFEYTIASYAGSRFSYKLESSVSSQL